VQLMPASAQCSHRRAHDRMERVGAIRKPEQDIGVYQVDHG